MASRVLLLIFLFTVGLSVRRSKGLELGLQFGVEPRDCVVSRHKPALLQCSSPSPNVSYQWTLDNRPLPLVNNSRLQLLSNGSLYFKKVVHKKAGQGASDQGVYRCIIRSPHGALLSQPAHLRFAYMSHEFLEVGHSVSVVEGDPALFSCSIDSLPAADISWEHNSMPLTHSDRLLILNNGTLIIKQVQQDDQGDYRCSASNSLVNRTRVSDSYTLTVEGREGPTQLEILRPLATRVNWTRGERVSLTCVARGTPTPAVKWTKLQHDQSSVLVTNITEGVSTLTIDSVMENHQGVYTCVASQVIGDKKLNTVSITKEVRVEEIFMVPVITKRPKSQEFPTAKTVRFHCEAEGNPTPEIVWFRNGQKLLINGRVKLRKELVLSNTVSNDSGVYQCIASNAAGVAWAAARLTVNVSRGQPRPPSRLFCSTLSSSSVLLSWEQPAPTSLQAFTIHYLPSDGGEEGMAVQEMAHDQLNQTYVVEKLPAFTNYTFYVRSYNSNAASDNSAEVVCRTGESVPRGVPKITVQPQSPMTVLVEWSLLPNSVAQGVVSEYKVQWRRRHNPSIHVELVPGDVTRYVIPGLVPDTEYEVRVLAATVKGWPSLLDQEMPWSLVKTSSLAEFTPLLPPPSVQLTAINSSTIQVRWKFSSDSSKVESFKLIYRKHNTPPSSPVLLPARSTEYVIHDLEPETWYEVQVKAVSGSVEGDIGVRTINTLPLLQDTSAPDLLLAPPTNLEATPTPLAISLTWDPPPPPRDANISFYTVSYRVVPTVVSYESNNSYLHSTSNGVIVSGLKPYTLYELKVRTHDHSNRHSEYSQTLECRTLEGVPERVQEVDWKPLNQSSVRVMWKSPEVTHGPLKGYTLSYTQQPSQPLELWQRLSLQGTRPAADVTGLTPNVRYFMVIQAATTSGLGNPSETVELLIPYARPKAKATPVFSPSPPEENDPFLGIVLGCAIGGCFVLLCLATIIYRRKCSKPGRNCQSSTANGTPCFHSHSDHHEMQCLPNHLDSKGGHSNGEVNGLKLPLLSNGRPPNGLVTRDRSVRITENPQFECGVTVSCEELRQPSDEGDSLLSGHSLNDTQLTTLTSQLSPGAAQLSDKHEPDDGFHESHQPIMGPNG